MHQRVALVHKTFSIISYTLYRLYVFFSLRSLLFSFAVCYYFCNIAPHDFAHYVAWLWVSFSVRRTNSSWISQKMERRCPGRNRCRDRWRRLRWRCSHLGASNLPSSYTYCLLETSPYIWSDINYYILSIVKTSSSTTTGRLPIFMECKNTLSLKITNYSRAKTTLSFIERDLPAVV